MTEVKGLANVRKALTKEFGVDAITTQESLKALAYIPYGVSPQCLSLDLSIGRPGLPAGRLTEVVGLDSHGKSTHGYHLLAECQRVGGVGVLIESESAFETKRLETVGVKVDDLLICQPKTMEEAFMLMERNTILLREGQGFEGPIVICWDSVAGTPASAEAEGAYDDDFMALHARFLSHGLRKLTRLIAKHKVVLVFFNQLKATMQQYGEPDVSFGGKSIKYHASLRIKVYSKKSDVEYDKDGEPVGTWITSTTIKNKLAKPYRKAEYYLSFDHGIDSLSDCQYAAEILGLVKDAGKGRFYFKVKDKFKSLLQPDWEGFVTERYGSPQAMRDRLILLAIKKGLLKPYGEASLK